MRTSVVGVCARAAYIMGLVVAATAASGATLHAQGGGTRLTGKVVDSTDHAPIPQAA